MDPQKQKEIASKGGKAAHQKGTAHEFTTEEARIAGRKGGAASRARRSQGGDGAAGDRASEQNAGDDQGAAQASAGEQGARPSDAEERQDTQ